MSTEAMKPDEPNTEDANRRLNRDVMDMISTLTRHLASLRGDHQPAGSDKDEHGASIITLAGSNSGATFKNLPSNLHADVAPDQESDVDPLEGAATLVNSNLQAINNSVMIGTKYKSHDPGVHVDVSEDLEPGDHKRRKRGGWKGKSKDRNASSAFESDAHSSGDDAKSSSSDE